MGIVSESEKLAVVFSSPAVLKVFSLNCNLFSLGEYVDADGNSIETPLTDLLKQPNFFQTERQFKWDAMFWTMIGTAIFTPSKKIISDETQLYWLNTAAIEYPKDLVDVADKIVFSIKTKNQIDKIRIKYNYGDGTSTSFVMRQVKMFFDLTNGTGNWFKGNSRLDALYKIVSNSEVALDSKSTNLRKTAEFIIAGKADLNDIHSEPMEEAEKLSIERNAMKGKEVTAVKSMIEIKRFVENLKDLDLDNSYDADLIRIADMYGMSKELLGVQESRGIGDKGISQDKARAAHVWYSLKPKGDDIINGIASFMGDTTEYFMSWAHLPFMKMSEKESSEIRKSDAETLKIYVEQGAEPNEAAELLGIDLKFTKPEPEPVNTIPNE